MFILVLSKLFKREKQVPDEFMRMVRMEYRSVPPEFVSYFYKKYGRLPTQGELYDAI
jgi:hypothetical protein